MRVMNYRGYAARIEYSEEDGCLVGHIAGIQDVVGFHGDSVEEIRAAFQAAVEDYLQAQPGARPPARGYSPDDLT